MFCSKCGAQMEELDLCPKCGMPAANLQSRVIRIENKANSSLTQNEKNDSNVSGCLSAIIIVAIIISVIYGLAHS